MDIIFKLILLIPLLLSLLFSWSEFGFWSLIPLWVIFGLIDVSRHKTMNFKLIKEYFMGKGVLTFLLSPLNLLTDLLSHRNLHTFKVNNLPPAHQMKSMKLLSFLIKTQNKLPTALKKLQTIIELCFFINGMVTNSMNQS